MPSPEPLEVHHDTGCLAATIRDAYCGCARRGWLTEMVPRYQARAEAFELMSRWSAERTVLAEGKAADPMPTESAFEKEALKAAARIASALYVEFGNRARAHLRECRTVEPKAAKPQDDAATPTIDVELPLFDVTGKATT